MKNYLLSGNLIFVLTLGAIGAASAAEQHGAHDMNKQEHSHKDGEKGDDHHATAHWAKSLTKEQKTEVDRMHQELDQKQEVLKADEALKQKELNTLTIHDQADQAEINRKIDELMAIKNRILRNRYEHLTEMRRILTDEQRESYDAAILKRDEIK